MYDYEFNEITKEYELLRCEGFGEYIIVGYVRTEREAYYWYCKKNGFIYDSKIKFDDEM